MKYFIYYPAGNTTVLVESSGSLDYADTAKAIIQANPIIEQVGFLEPAKLPSCDFHLEMMGREFCGNAARCAALHYSLEKNNNQLKFTVSGFDTPVTAGVFANKVTLNLPGDFLISLKTTWQGCLVDFRGIRFIVTGQALSETDRNSLIKTYQDSFPAIGIVQTKPTSQGCHIIPHVWVRSTRTFIAETACCSGSLAAALLLRSQGWPLPHYIITQPSGYDYEVAIEDSNNSITSLSLSGEVRRV